MTRLILRLLTGIISLPLIYFAASLIGAILPGAQASFPHRADIQIGLIRGPIHYDFLLPLTPDLRAHYGFAQNQGVPVFNPNAQWLVVGWGAETFYSTTGSYTDMTLGSVTQALSGDDSAMHLDVVGNLQGIDGIDYLTVSTDQYTALIAAIDASFQHDQTGAALALDVPGLGAHDAFYAANGRFHGFRTCNVWIGETLRAAGVPFGAWTPTPQSVAFALYWHQPKTN